jgi:RNA-directed DNA polymerase
LETAIVQAFPATKNIEPNDTRKPRTVNWRPKIVRYADDFVILHQDLHALREAHAYAISWLRGMGLELKPEKTRITHTLRKEFDKPGIDFLGFNIRQHEQRITHAKKQQHRIRNLCTLIKPSKDSIAAHRQNLSKMIRSMRTASQEDLIQKLNPKITGWTNYQAIGIYAARCKIDNILYQQLKRWTRRRHPMRHWGWVARKYWRLETGKWTFGTPDRTAILSSHVRRKTRRYSIQSTASVYDGNWVYWATRLGRHPSLTPSRAKLLKQQHGRCAYCGLYFRADSDVMELDHIIPTSHGGKTAYRNIQLLHAHCHDAKTARDRADGINVSNRIIEEPDEGKLSRPVLKTSTPGD